MIISRTPIRISLVGGSTDIANFYRQYGGEVISTAIDKYISVRITRRRNSQIAINTPHHHETVSDPDHIQHPLIREAVRKTFPPASGLLLPISLQGSCSSVLRLMSLIGFQDCVTGQRCQQYHSTAATLAR